MILIYFLAFISGILEGEVILKEDKLAYDNGLE